MVMGGLNRQPPYAGNYYVNLTRYDNILDLAVL